MSEAIGFKAGQSAGGGLGDEREVSPTVNSQPSALEPTVAINVCGFKYKAGAKSQQPIGGETAQALSSECHDSAVGIRCAPINSMVLGKEPKPGDRQTLGFGEEGDPSPTIQANHHHAVAIADTISQMKYIVRRLTPVECERLMGLPDGWTIPSNLTITDELVEEFRQIHDTFNRIMAEYDGKPPPKPKSANQVRKWLEKIANPDTCPDSPRYKGCGNGWATNQPRWILTRLIKAM